MPRWMRTPQDVILPTKLLKLGTPEDVDLRLLLLEEEKLPAFSCRACGYVKGPPWPGDPATVVDAGHAAQSHIVSPQVLPFTLRNKFSTLIADVATTGSRMPARHHEPKDYVSNAGR